VDSRGLLNSSVVGLASPPARNTPADQPPPLPVCLLQPSSPPQQQLTATAGGNSFDQLPQQQHLVQRGVSVGVSDRLVVATAQSSSSSLQLPPLHSPMSRHLASLSNASLGRSSSSNGLLSPNLPRERIQVF
jgi:hypothetical protein